jgi:hypothetical protein
MTYNNVDSFRTRRIVRALISALLFLLHGLSYAGLGRRALRLSLVALLVVLGIRLRFWALVLGGDEHNGKWVGHDILKKRRCDKKDSLGGLVMDSRDFQFGGRWAELSGSSEPALYFPPRNSKLSFVPHVATHSSPLFFFPSCSLCRMRYICPVCPLLGSMFSSSAPMLAAISEYPSRRLIRYRKLLTRPPRSLRRLHYRRHRG